MSSKNPETKRCNKCREAFQLLPGERELREAHPLGAFPLPTLCPPCRYRRRLANRNEWTWYHRKCSATGRQIVSIYPHGSEFPVFSDSYWWGDGWNASDYGRSPDFSRPFFEQYSSLRRVVPRIAFTNPSSVNSMYTNQSSHNTNCYVLVASNHNERCLYGNWFQHCEDCVDCSILEQSRDCYECSMSSGLERCYFVTESADCRDAWFSSRCFRSAHLFGCHGLRDAEYAIWNEPVGRVAFEAFLSTLAKDRASFEALRNQAEAFRGQFPQPVLCGSNNTAVSGNDLSHCRNASFCFNCRYADNLVSAQDAWKITDGFDQTETLSVVRSGEIEGCFQVQNSFCLSKSWNISSSAFSELCFDSHDLLGCIGIKRGHHSILNIAYSRHEYERLRAKLFSLMKETGELGEFFPAEGSIFGYNESLAAEYFPLTEGEATDQGFPWHPERKEEAYYIGPTVPLPEHPQAGLERSVFFCAHSGRPFRFLKEELEFYSKHGLPLPDRSPAERRKARLRARPPRQLWERTCMSTRPDGSHCQARFLTSLAPESSVRVYCAACYAG